MSFRIPIDRSERTFETISYFGTKCYTLCEAESEAAVAVLLRLELSVLQTTVIDTSELCSEKKDHRCKRLLQKAGKMFRRMKILLYDYAEAVQMIDNLYA